jgi:hypothetical protein
VFCKIPNSLNLFIKQDSLFSWNEVIQWRFFLWFPFCSLHYHSLCNSFTLFHSLSFFNHLSPTFFHCLYFSVSPSFHPPSLFLSLILLSLLHFLSFRCVTLFCLPSFFLYLSLFSSVVVLHLFHFSRITFQSFIFPLAHVLSLSRFYLLPFLSLYYAVLFTLSFFLPLALPHVLALHLFVSISLFPVCLCCQLLLCPLTVFPAARAPLTAIVRI